MFQFLAKRRSSVQARSISESRKQRGFRVRRVGLETLEPRRVLSTVNWTGAAGDQSWGDANNWDTHALPGAADDVKINVAGPLTITHSSGNDTVLSITSTSNQVALDISGGNLSILANSVFNGVLTNESLLDIAGGTTFLNGGTTSVGGNIVADAGAELQMEGHVSIDSTSSISGAGIVDIAFAGTATVGGTYNVSGTTNVFGDTDFSGSVLSVGHDLTANATADFHNTALSVANLSVNEPGGHFLRTGDLAVSGSLHWTSGMMTGAGTTTVAAGGTLTIDTALGRFLDARTLTNLGTGTWDTSYGVSNVILDNGAVFNNAGTLNALGYSKMNSSVGGGTFNNTGVLTVTAIGGSAGNSIRSNENENQGVEIRNVAFNNSGSVHVMSGGFGTNGGGTSSGSYLIDPGCGLGIERQSLTASSSILGLDANVMLSGDVVGGLYNVTSSTSVVAGSGDTDFTGTVLSVGHDLLTSATADFHSTALSVTNLTVSEPGSHFLRSGNLDVSGALTWTIGTITGAGATTVAAGGTLSIGTGTCFLDGRTLTNLGTGSLNTVIVMENGAVFDNAGTLDAQGTSRLESANGGGTFNNTELLTVTATGGNDGQGFGTGQGVVFNSGITFNNSGSVQVLSGGFVAAGGGTSSGSFTVATDSGLALFAQTLTATSSVVGNANVRLTGDTVAGTYNVTGSTSVFPGAGDTDFTGTVLSVGHDLLTSATADFHSTALSVTNLTVSEPGSHFLRSGNLDVSGALTWTIGTITGAGATTVAAGGTLSIGTGTCFLDGRTLTNLGTGSLNTVIVMENGAVFDNVGTIDLHSSTQFVSSAGGGTFNNSGLVTAVGTGTVSFDAGVAFNNSGVVQIDHGTLSAAGGYHQTGGISNSTLDNGTLSSTLALDIQGGQVTGSGTISGSLTNAGQVVPGMPGNPIGVIQVTGNYVQTSSGALGIALGGTVPGTQYSQLKVGGSATLDGTLDVSLVNGFTPAAGDTFHVLTFGSHSGDFAVRNGLDLGNHKILTPAYHAADLTLTCEVTVVPLTVTVNPSTKTYGQPNPIFTITYAGFLSGDDPSVLQGQPIFVTPATQTSDVGNYVVSVSGLSSTKYDIQFVSGNLAITPAPITVSVNSTTWQIGTPFPPAFSASYSGFVLGQNASVLGGTLSFSTTANQNSPVGDYPVTASGLSSNNYAITYVNGTLSVIVQSDLGILLLDPTGKGALTVSGNGSVSVTAGEIVVDSSSNQAVKVTGNGQVGAVEIDTKGVTTSGHGTIHGLIDTADPSMADPLAGLAAPSVPTTVRSSSTLNISGSGQLTLQPGLYIGGIKISGQAQVTLAPGIYYLQGGGFSVSGQATVTGTDVLLYNAPAKASDTISFTGQGEINLTGLYGGAYQGLVIFQDRTSSAALNLTGQGNLNLVGTVYAAGATLNISGNGSLNMTGSSQQHIADHLILADLQVSGNGGAFIDASTNALVPDGVDYYFANY